MNADQRAKRLPRSSQSVRSMPETSRVNAAIMWIEPDRPHDRAAGRDEERVGDVDAGDAQDDDAAGRHPVRDPDRDLPDVEADLAPSGAARRRPRRAAAERPAGRVSGGRSSGTSPGDPDVDRPADVAGR